MIVRSKAPLRLGFAGGGTDVSPYSDIYGGLILNATINLFAYCTIEERSDGIISFVATDLLKKCEYNSSFRLSLDGVLDLHKAVYNRIVENFKIFSTLAFTITTFTDAPPGSGLGSSSTLVVAIIKAFAEWLMLPLGEYEIAQLAFKIEREDLNLSGGKQDQYAAAFGGFNFMEFYSNNRIIVNPLRVKRWIIDEMEASIILYYTGASRSSAAIIDEQIRNTTNKNEAAIEAMHLIKQSAIKMKESILKGDIKSFAEILGNGWENKKKMAQSISNSQIDNVFEVALRAGATTGKVSGAGGGGFIIFVVDPLKKMNVVSALNSEEGNVVNFQFSEGGCHGWKIY